MSYFLTFLGVIEFVIRIYGCVVILQNIEKKYPTKHWSFTFMVYMVFGFAFTYVIGLVFAFIRYLLPL